MMPEAGQSSARPERSTSSGGRSERELVLVGGGLQSALIALAVLHARPDAAITVVEREERFGGNHTWCFHAADVPAAWQSVVEPLVEVRWPDYEVLFPGVRRTLDMPYALVSSERLHRVLSQALAAAPNADARLGAEATELHADRAVLAGGEVLEAGLVVDARGPVDDVDPAGSGFQKFVGLELRLERPHGLTRPVVMDAEVPQLDGFRFVYVLPLDPHRLLVEDTCFADGPRLRYEALRDGCLAYVAAQGWAVAAVEREESGVLPMPWTAVGEETAPSGPLRAGYRGGWFHPGTGYSFPVAMRLAVHLAESGPSAARGAAFEALRRAHEHQASFARRLNYMLFRWFPPEDRWNVLARFYRTLPEPSIRRFYALETSAADRARMLVGRPPRGLSIRRAISALRSLAGPR